MLPRGLAGEPATGESRLRDVEAGRSMGDVVGCFLSAREGPSLSNSREASKKEACYVIVLETYGQ